MLNIYKFLLSISPLPMLLTSAFGCQRSGQASSDLQVAPTVQTRAGCAPEIATMARLRTFIPPRATLAAIAGPGYIKAIEELTRNSSVVQSIQRGESEDAIRARRWTDTHIANAKRDLRVIREGNRHYIEETGGYTALVYRGVRGIPKQVVEGYKIAMLNGRPIGLGYEGQPAIVSSSRDSKVAKDFSNKGDFARFPGVKFEDRVHVFFEVEDPRGVPIENISRYPEQKEVLIDGEYQITSINKLPSPAGELDHYLVHLKRSDPSLPHVIFGTMD